MTITIERAGEEDYQTVVALLRSCGLPEAGLSDHRDKIIVARSGETIIGSAALEIYGNAALLRSVAVDKAWRGSGLGQRLTQAALAMARERGVAEIYLLTETAGKFFPRFGFQPIERSEVPATVQNSVEFVSCCPSSALAMRLDIASAASEILPGDRFKTS